MITFQWRTITAAGVVIAIACAFSPVAIRSSPPGGPRLNLIPIVYGLPSAKLVERAARHEVWLGGCVSDSLSPRWVLLI